MVNVALKCANVTTTQNDSSRCKKACDCDVIVSDFFVSHSIIPGSKSIGLLPFCLPRYVT